MQFIKMIVGRDSSAMFVNYPIVLVIISVLVSVSLIIEQPLYYFE